MGTPSLALQIAIINLDKAGHLPFNPLTKKPTMNPPETTTLTLGPKGAALVEFLQTKEARTPTAALLIMMDFVLKFTPDNSVFEYLKTAVAEAREEAEALGL